MDTTTMPAQIRERQSAALPRVRVSAFTIPTATPESDGTLEWNATVLVLVEIEAGGKTGIGFSLCRYRYSKTDS